MRINLLICMITLAFVHVNANSYGQHVTLREQGASLQHVLEKIRKQSGYNVLYNVDMLNAATPVTITVENASITSVLDQVLAGQPLTYTLKKETVVIKKKELATGRQANARYLQARDTLVSGTVYTLLEGRKVPAPGASVQEKGTNRSASTDENGRFSIRTSPRSTLVVSLLGYAREEVPVVAGQPFGELILQEYIRDIDEVIITGYMSQEKRSITGAMSSIRKESIENMPVQSLDRAMQGQASGVNVTGSNGVPGGPVRVNIRGMGSITAGNQPLFIVDGIQLNMDLTSDQTASNPLSFLNHNDIESIEILKDGAAASIYGAQAANGVVLITTKKGAAGGKTAVNVNYYNGITSPMPFVNMMNSQQLIDARMEARNNRYPTRTAERNRTDVLSSFGLPTAMTDVEIAGLPTYDWQDAAFTTGRTNNVELALSGGNDKTTFFASGSYNNTDGNVIGIDFERVTGRLNLTHAVNSRLGVEWGINMSSITQNGTSGSSGSSGAYAAPQYAAPMILPWIPPFLEDGSHNGPIEGFPGSSNRNPIQETALHTLQSRTKALVSNLQASYSIMKGLSFRSFYGLDYRFIDDERYVDPRTRSGAASQGSLTIGNRQNRNFLTNQTFNYKGDFEGGHHVSGVLGAEYRYDNRQTSSVSGTGFTTHQFRSLQSAAIITNGTGSWTGFKRLGFFGQANYDYQKRYLVSAVLRYDGSSRFGANNKFGWFPGLSAGWNIAEEDFLQARWLDQLKLRVGYGETGNDAIGNFDARALFGSSSSNSYGQEPGIRPSGIANTDLRWERNVTTNIGLDYALFRGRIAGSAELFRRRSKDLLLDRPLPYLSGYSNVTSNVGELKNEGIELELRTTNVKAGDFSWTTNFNITFLRNEVVSLSEGDEILPGNQSVRVGHSLGTNFTYHYAGVNSATGRPMWYDAMGEITYNPIDTDRRIFGNQMSDYFGGFTNEFSYKGVSLNVFFHYDMGRELSNAGMNTRWFRNGQDSRNSLEDIYLRRWTTPGQLTTVPRPFDGGAETNGMSMNSTSSRFLEDASFIRLKQVALSYSLPADIASKLHTRSVRLYAQAHNLHTWTKWTGYDPELVINEGDFSSTQGTVPQTRAYTFGIQVGF